MPTEPPLAARTAQPTSQLAAQQLQRTGKQRKQALVVADVVCRRPGLTSAELSRLAGNDAERLRHLFGRRLPDAEMLRLVQRGLPRRCSITGRKAFVWNPVLPPARISGSK